MKQPFILLLCYLCCVFATTGFAAPSNIQTINLGTGSTKGVYYVVGKTICLWVNKETNKHGIRCVAKPSNGSIANLRSVRVGLQQMAVAQSDWHFHAYYGKHGQLQANKKLRSLFSVHAEPFTVVARQDSQIKNIDDLRYKRVNIGNRGSGQRGTMELLIDAKGWHLNDFAKIMELKADYQANALCSNQVDAIVYVVGHPSKAIQQAMNGCSTTLVPVVDNAIDKLVKQYSYYTYSTIPAGLYTPKQPDVTTFGVAATFVTSEDIDAEVVYQVVKAVFDNLLQFKRAHPAFKQLKPKNMIRDGLTAPLHRGAVRYYQEKKWF